MTVVSLAERPHLVGALWALPGTRRDHSLPTALRPGMPAGAAAVSLTDPVHVSTEDDAAVDVGPDVGVHHPVAEGSP